VKVEANLTLKDLNVREILTLTPILVLIFWIGLYPQPFFDLISPSVDNLVSLVTSALVAVH